MTKEIAMTPLLFDSLRKLRSGQSDRIGRLFHLLWGAQCLSSLPIPMASAVPSLYRAIWCSVSASISVLCTMAIAEDGSERAPMPLAEIGRSRG
jgi:hypothetical protein